MQIDMQMHGNYRLIRFNTDIDARSNISELLLSVESDIEGGITRFAIAFTPNSYLYSKTISVLVKCMNVVREVGGCLAVVSPNPKLLEALRMFRLDTMLIVCPSIDALPDK